MYARGLSKRVQIRFVVVVFFLLCLKAHHCNAAATTDRSFVYAQAQAIKKSGGNPATSSYFRRDPYGANTYAFGFEVNDNRTGNVQFRDERRYVNGSVEGSFGHVRPDGRVIVTHFLSDNERGFRHETRTFEAGDSQQWQAHWPTKRPSILMERPPDMPTGGVVYDKDLHLNVTTSKVPEQLANALNEQHGIDVNAASHAGNAMADLAIQDIIDGKVPLQTKPGKAETHIGFQTVNSLLPTDFPIAPFILPPMLANVSVGSQQTVQKNAIEPKLQEMKKQQNQNKYNEAKVNNSEKSVNVQVLEKSAGNNTKVAASTKAVRMTTEASNNNNRAQIVTELPTSLPEDSQNIVGVKGTWYQQLIDQSRNEFLSTLPNKQ